MQIITSLYAYCSDFIMNVAHLTGLSYYEVNAILFCYLFPFAFFFLLFGNVYLWFRVRRINVKNDILEQK